MPERPRVTVIMAVFRDAPYVAAAAQSIFQQTWTDLELVVVDDASDDGSAGILERLADPRLRLIRNPANMGLTLSLVRGLEEAQGDFVARMDADDIAAPQRLARQLALFDAKPQVGIVGTDCVDIDKDGLIFGARTYPVEDVAIRWGSLLRNPFCHPSVMLRQRVLVENRLTYDPAFPTAQDYDLWTRMLRHTAGANLPQPLLSYRVRAGGITDARRAEQVANHDRVAARTIAETLPEVPVDEATVTALRGLFAFGGESMPGLASQRVPLCETYLCLLRAFARHHRDAPEMAAVRREAVLAVLDKVLARPRPLGWASVAARALKAETSPATMRRLFSRLGRGVAAPGPSAFHELPPAR